MMVESLVAATDQAWMCVILFTRGWLYLVVVGSCLVLLLCLVIAVIDFLIDLDPGFLMQ